MTRTVAVIGAGVMGAGIAQVVLEAGDSVALYDLDPVACEQARGRIAEGLARRARKLGVGDAWVADHLARRIGASSLEAAARDADIVIEAAIEDLDAKRSLFRALDGAAHPEAILATNTSALRVGDIATAAHRPQRVLGLHWFNPAPVMALVEVIATDRTDLAVIDRAEAIVRSWGKTPVRSADTPGFIVNRVNRPFTIEALRLLEAGAADIATIDAAMRAAGFPMGPFELMDLAGLDVNLAAARGIWAGLGRPEHMQPSPIQEQLVAAGRLGRKTGEGFYRYDEDGRRGEPTVAARPGPSAVDPAAIVARITAAIDAEAARAEADGVASRDDIELALRLGVGHPLRSTP